MANGHKRADGTVLCGGYMQNKDVKNASQFSAGFSKDKQLPARVDLRSKMTPVENQGETNSCTANAVVGAYECLLKQLSGKNIDISRLFVYYNARKKYIEKFGGRMSDSGSCISLAIDTLKENGICKEKTWQFNKQNINKQPNKQSYDEATNLKIKEAKFIKLDLNEWKQALAEGHPIIFAVKTYPSFMEPHRRRGVIPMPGAKDSQNRNHGNHAMLCVGYNDADQMFIVRNSWGENWGDNGYCYMPYNYLISNYNNNDSWVLYGVEDIDESVAEEDWSDEEESMLPEISNIFADMDEESFDAMLDEMGDYGIDYRLGVLYTIGCCMDEDFSEAEKEAAAQHLNKALKAFGLKMNAKKIIKNCINELGQDEDFLTETIDIFGRYLPTRALKSIAKDMEEVAAVDGLDKEEKALIDELVGAWLEYEEELEDFDDDEDWEFDDDDDFSWDEDEDSEESDDDELDEEIDLDDEGELTDDDVKGFIDYLREEVEDWDEVAEACGDYDIAQRIAATYAWAASVGNKESKALALDHLEDVIDLFEYDSTPQKLYKAGQSIMEEVTTETVAILAGTLSDEGFEAFTGVLSYIINSKKADEYIAELIDAASEEE